MGIERFIGAVFGLMCLYVLGTVMAKWFRRVPIAPDPWDAKIAAGPEDDLSVPVCHHCFTPLEPRGWYCPQCNSSVGPYNNCLPFPRAFALGEVFRNGVHEHIGGGAIVVLGYLLSSAVQYSIFAPVYWYFLFKNLANYPIEEPPDNAVAPSPPIE